MKENRQHQAAEVQNKEQKQGKKPVQPEEPVGNITSSEDNVRRPEHDANIPPEEQTKGNP
ncbi:hypothetical protein GCM10027443_18590 [Pontibacter brevis]